ncbi:hypothetical protein QX249_10765 [Vibrio parahaemolyticus]|uniref:Uncharacterized protein n=1 Tax=Vibrio parahaemolyticus TaxID=670 RepID=A0AAW8Q3X5_VIBPH|nr:hypothetical protein [Vibrio parahaemolyticus]MDS1821143.1 hypothetical protein [Vibrio parahaemolyticus]
MNNDVKINESDKEIDIVLNGASLMKVDKSNFADRDSAVKFAEDSLSLIYVGYTLGSSMALIDFVDSLPNTPITTTELKLESEKYLKSRFGDGIKFPENK